MLFWLARYIFYLGWLGANQNVSGKTQYEISYGVPWMMIGVVYPLFKFDIKMIDNLYPED